MARLQLTIGFTLGNLAALAALALPGPVPGTPETYGVGAESVYQATAFDFQATDSRAAIGTDADAYRYMAPPSTSLFLLAPLHLPEGAVIDFFRFHNCDPAGGNMVAFLIDFSGDHESAILGSVASTPRAGCGNDVALIIPAYQNVANLGHHLLLSIDVGGPTDATVKFDRVEVFYRLAVSAAPAAPDFGDVPVSHPFFQFVEALYQSGITAGCGGGNFCPDAPLTRGQMAVFLAKALGLHWPNTIAFP